MADEQVEEKRNIDGCKGCIESHADENYPGRACSCFCHYTRAELESRIDFQDERLREAGLAIARLTREARPPPSAELRALAEQNDKAAEPFTPEGRAKSTDHQMVRLITIQNSVLITVMDRLLKSEVGAPR